MGGENELDRGWREGESEKDRRWREKESERGREWESGESALEREWKKWNTESGQKWSSGENRLREEHERSQQGNMFRQQEKMARLQAELRGYMTPGAAYGGNAAGATRPGGNQVNAGTQSPALTPGTLDAGRAGLGYGTPRAQARMFQNSGTNVESQFVSGNTERLIGSRSSMPQPIPRGGPGRKAIRGKGKAGMISSFAGGGMGSGDPGSPVGAHAGVASGLKKNQAIAEAGASGGLYGAAMEAGKQEQEGQRRLGVGLGNAIGSSFA